MNTEPGQQAHTPENVESLIARELAAGTAFPLLVSKLHAHASQTLFREDKVAVMAPDKRSGYVTVAQPLLGMMRPMRVDLCSEVHGLLIQHVIDSHIHDGLDAVFDMGCGLGLDLVCLAARRPALKFYGGDVTPMSHRTVAMLAQAAKLNNVTPVTFDINAPDFTPIAGKDVLIYSQFALVYANPFPRTFFPALLDAVRSVHALLFEPVSFALPELTHPPLFARERARGYRIAEDLWEVIRDLQTSGRIAIEEVVPDISGRSAMNAVTLLRFRKVL